MGIDVKHLINDASFDQTPLFEASACKDQDKALRLCNFFMEQGVACTTQDSLKQLPIFYAVREGNLGLIETFVGKGAPINHVDTYGQTPIFYSIREGNISATQKMVALKANPDVVDNNGQTPLFYAIRHNKFEMCEYLIQQGVNLRVLDKKGISPSHWAKRYNQGQILDLLLQNGAIPLNEGKSKKAAPKAAPAQVEAAEPKPKVNERKIPRRYLLTTLREGGYYEPLSDEEFEKFKVDYPDVAKYFLEAGDEGSEAVAPIASLPVPQVN